ncbi:MAG: class I SAM-dependent methyltransferase [Candidatus Kerfeldbacteria bacterium]|nr:class I SAM-dependent methyltransferase [Candidatus Kerfeldbacteria bacterium]
MPAYDSYTHHDAFGPKRWSHQRRFHDGLRLLQLHPHDRLLDYGCGDGYFLKLCAKAVPEATFVGYDPLANMADQARQALANTKIVVTETLAELQTNSFSHITCLETCEHLVPDALDQTLRDIRDVLDPRGLAVFSVPVEIGPVSLVKNLYRHLRRPTYENWTWRNLWQATVGLPVAPFINQALGHPYIFSHIGFDHRRFAARLRSDFRIERVVYTPFSGLGFLCNPTVYYLCRPRP